MNKWNNAETTTSSTPNQCNGTSETIKIPTTVNVQYGKPEYVTSANSTQENQIIENTEIEICTKLKNIKIPTVHTKTKPKSSELNTNSNICSSTPKFSVKKRCRQAIKTTKKQNKGKTTQQFTCGQCPKIYTSLAGIRSHLASHCDPNICGSNCQDSIFTFNELNRDTKSKHLAENEIRCNKCDKTFKSKRNLRVHLQTHTGERPYGCKQCGKRFTQSAALYTHTKIHLGLKEHVCSYCNKAFTERKNMKNHERTHTKERPFECSTCFKGFGDPSALRRHVRIHTGDKMYQCQMCHMKFHDASGLIAHKKRHDDVKDFACDFCGKQFSTHQMLSNHESSVHMNIKKFLCDICHKSFTLKQYLKSHIQRNHMQSVECGICEMKFFSNTHLLIHKSKGCVRDRFACDHCGITFSLKRLVKKHMEEKHFETLYCHICMRKFYSDLDLQKHKLKANCTKKFINAKVDNRNL
ncbi:uncharacterized protein [Choristoneura fumiferana]|uniref:uncharacterized protein n=1 Tax=Choristoneura fumiferana TaxID=7141 RepID=UPI003D15BAB3